MIPGWNQRLERPQLIESGSSGSRVAYTPVGQPDPPRRNQELAEQTACLLSQFFLGLFDAIDRFLEFGQFRIPDLQTFPDEQGSGLGSALDRAGLHPGVEFTPGFRLRNWMGKTLIATTAFATGGGLLTTGHRRERSTRIRASQDAPTRCPDGAV